MYSIFSPDNLFFRFMTKVCYGAVLSLMWLVCSIPLVSIGAATAALNDVMRCLVRDEEGYILKSFFKAFKKYFRKATAVWLVCLIAFLILSGDILFFIRMGNKAGIVCAVLFTMVLFILELLLTHVFHNLVWFNNYTWKEVLRNSLKISLGYLPYSFGLLVLAAAMLYSMYVSVPLMVTFFFFGMGIFSYISAYMWGRILERQKLGSIRNII